MTEDADRPPPAERASSDGSEAAAARVAERARAAGRRAAQLAGDASREVRASAERAFGASRDALARATAHGDGDQKPFLKRLFPRRPSAMVVALLAISGPILALLTYLVYASDPTPKFWFQLLIVLDICYLVGLMSLVGLQIARIAIARRARSAGSRLHGRMVAVFIGVAAVPTVLVAVMFFLAIQSRVEAWFTDRVSTLVQNSTDAVDAYERAVLEATRGQSVAVAQALNDAAGLVGRPDDPRFRLLLDSAAVEAGFSHAYVISPDGAILARGFDTFAFDYIPPEPDAIARAQENSGFIRPERGAGEFRALLRLDPYYDGALLYLWRPIDSALFETRAIAETTIREYQQVEREREVEVAQFVAFFLGFALLILTAAIYAGLWFAERLMKPIGRLAAAAQRVRSGDLVVRVKEERGDDEIALLSRVFNRMTEEVQRKQEALKTSNAESEQRRLFSEAVLSGVSAGVVGLDASGRIRLMNDPAARLLGLDPETAVGRPLSEAAPEFKQLFQDARLDPALGVERPVRILRGGEELELMARITSQRVARRRHAEGGFVVTLDDVTALVSAQRLAAWGDVARRIAHEIKNPLTPIQLAAERLKRKYSDRLGDDAESFERYTETIVRQTGDIGRMVDAFSRFARMPTPTMAEEPIVELTRQAISLQEEGRASIRYRLDLDAVRDAPLILRCDRGQIHQALTNLLQNAADALDARLERDRQPPEAAEPPLEIRVAVVQSAESVSIMVSDNGVGLPARDRRRLLEPYVTTREKGTGLGLAIVAKIIEEHHGVFELGEAEPFADGAAAGAAARITLPLPTRDAARPTLAAPDDATTPVEDTTAVGE